MPRFLPGDLIGFSGWSRLGVGINFFSCGLPLWHLSHIGIIARHPEHALPLLCESTTQYRRPCVVTGRVTDGVQWHLPRGRIKQYRGLVWHYRLREPLTLDESVTLSDFLMEMTGRGYDALGALGARDMLLAVLVRIGKHEDLTSLFCSELCAAALQRVGRTPPINASGFSPNRLARKAVLCWKGHHRPEWIKRRPCSIPDSVGIRR